MKFIAAAGLAMAVLYSPVRADTVASAMLTFYRYELVDLDPNDGITPSITLGNERLGVELAVAPYLGAEPVEYVHFGEPGLGVGIAGGAGDSNGGSISHPDYMNSDTFVGNSGYVRAKGLWEADYTLSANTKLVFTGQAQAWLNASNPPAGDYFAAATVAVQFANPDVGPALPFYSRTVSTLDPTRFEEMLMVELVNDSDLALSSHLSVWVETEGSVTAVPEPATWLMLGAGLALTRTLARRRASRGAAAA